MLCLAEFVNVPLNLISALVVMIVTLIYVGLVNCAVGSVSFRRHEQL